MRDAPDPNDFVDVDAAFEDDYDADSITLATFTIIPGDACNAALVYYERGHSLYGGSGGSKWAIHIYSHLYNGQNLPLHDPDEPRHVLENLAGTDDLASHDWAGSDRAYFE